MRQGDTSRANGQASLYLAMGESRRIEDRALTRSARYEAYFTESARSPPGIAPRFVGRGCCLPGPSVAALSERAALITAHARRATNTKPPDFSEGSWGSWIVQPSYGGRCKASIVSQLHQVKMQKRTAEFK